MSKIIDEAKEKVRSADLYSLGVETQNVGFENGELKELTTKEARTSGLRVISNDGQIGFSKTNDSKDVDVVSRALALSKHGKKVDFLLPTPCGSQDVPTGELLDLFEVKGAIEKCQHAIEFLKKLGDVLVSCGVGQSNIFTILENTNGVDIRQMTSRFSWYAGITQSKEGNFISLSHGDVGPSLGDFDGIFDKLRREYSLYQENVKLKSGEHKVIFSPDCLMQLLAVFDACLSGMAVAKNMSPWKERRGDRIFDKRISFLSDPTDDFFPFRVAYDDEGTPTNKVFLIKDGVLRSFYHSLESASMAGQNPTGHGFRPGVASPAPSLNYIKMIPGVNSRRGMMKEAYLYVDQLLGLNASKPLSGILSGGIGSGYLVDKLGYRVARVKDAMLNINIFEAFKNNLLGISKEVDRKSASMLPYVLIDKVSVVAQ